MSDKKLFTDSGIEIKSLYNAGELDLSPEELKDIIAFVHALTDTTGLTREIKILPKFNNKILDERKPGGLY